ncbi:MAG: hypothetical protein IRY99_25745, partial [Isosphaeraceae bacterium]|nr:hypothetical protein [Isosphaeraceae bacterium]
MTRSNDTLSAERIRTARRLKEWINKKLDLEIAHRAVCCGHVAPWDYFAAIYLQRPPLALVLGPRGGGKSFLSALDAHLTSRWNPNHGTRILGASLSQSEQVYHALRELVRAGPEAETIQRLLKEGAVYKNGSEVKVLAASRTSVRGPHVPSLKLDEVDEIDPEIREAALGMCMNRHGLPASVVMTSTWHKVGGPMEHLLERGRAGDFPVYSFCIFEVLEACPESRSGPNLERCPECPIVRWCHEDRDQDPHGRPKAKRSKGHYALDALIQKARVTSVRTFEADYLCKGPKTDGLWFPAFDIATHVDPRAEYDPSLPVHVAIDSGVFTGAVFFQVATLPVPGGVVEEVRVFADYLAENQPAEAIAQAIRDLARRHRQDRLDVVSTDPAGKARTAIGPTVLGEYERGGLRHVQHWPNGASKLDGLALIDSFVQAADGRSRLVLHPRCQPTIRALQNYRRAR